MFQWVSVCVSEYSCVYDCLCVSQYVCKCMSVCLSVAVSVCVCVSQCMSVCLSVIVILCVCMCLSVAMSVRVSRAVGLMLRGEIGLEIWGANGCAVENPATLPHAHMAPGSSQVPGNGVNCFPWRSNLWGLGT